MTETVRRGQKGYHLEDLKAPVPPAQDGRPVAGDLRPRPGKGNVPPFLKRWRTLDCGTGRGRRPGNAKYPRRPLRHPRDESVETGRTAGDAAGKQGARYGSNLRGGPGMPHALGNTESGVEQHPCGDTTCPRAGLGSILEGTGDREEGEPPKGARVLTNVPNDLAGGEGNIDACRLPGS